MRISEWLCSDFFSWMYPFLPSCFFAFEKTELLHSGYGDSLRPSAWLRLDVWKPHRPVLSSSQSASAAKACPDAACWHHVSPGNCILHIHLCGQHCIRFVSALVHLLQVVLFLTYMLQIMYFILDMADFLQCKDDLLQSFSFAFAIPPSFSQQIRAFWMLDHGHIKVYNHETLNEQNGLHTWGKKYYFN